MNPTLVPPAKVIALRIADVILDGSSNAGTVSLLVYVPTHRIHFSISVGDFPHGMFAWGGSTWTLTPMMGNYPPGSGSDLPPPQDMCPLQPVISAGQLPAGFEAESAIRLWKADITFALGARRSITEIGQVMAVATFEATGELSNEERAYWQNLCAMKPNGPIPIVYGT